jgi:hypothetical protein
LLVFDLVSDLAKIVFEEQGDDPGRAFEWRSQRTCSAPALTYWRETFRAPFWPIYPAIATIAVLASGSVWVTVFFLALVVAFSGFVSTGKTFRSWVDKKADGHDEDERRTRQATARLLLSQEDRRRLEYLEDLTAGIRDKLGRGNLLQYDYLEQELALSALVANYVRCGVALRARRDCVSGAKRDFLERRLDRLRQDDDSRNIRRQRELLRCRLANFCKLERETARLEATMSAIVDYAEMIDERCVPPVPEVVPDPFGEEAMFYDERSEGTVQLLYDLDVAHRMQKSVLGKGE